MSASVTFTQGEATRMQAILDHAQMLVRDKKTELNRAQRGEFSIFCFFMLSFIHSFIYASFIQGEDEARRIRDRDRTRDDLADQYDIARDEKRQAEDALRQAERDEVVAQRNYDRANQHYMNAVANAASRN
jgi:hypothetical protein